MAPTLVYDVDLACDVKDLLVRNSDVSVEPALRSRILAFSDNTLLRVTKSLSSLKILNVDVIDDSYLSNTLKSGK